MLLLKVEYHQDREIHLYTLPFTPHTREEDYKKKCFSPSRRCLVPEIAQQRENNSEADT